MEIIGTVFTKYIVIQVVGYGIYEKIIFTERHMENNNRKVLLYVVEVERYSEKLIEVLKRFYGEEPIQILIYKILLEKLYDEASYAER